MQGGPGLIPGSGTRSHMPQLRTQMIDGETVETVSDFFGRAPKSLQMVVSTMKLKDAYSLEEKL